jgi:hypothetical protein
MGRGPIDPSLWKMAELFLIRSSPLRKAGGCSLANSLETIAFMEEGDCVGFSQEFNRCIHNGCIRFRLSSNIGVCIRLFFLTLWYASPTNKAKSAAFHFLALSRVYSSVDPKAPTTYQKRFIPLCTSRADLPPSDTRYAHSGMHSSELQPQRTSS